MGIFAGIDLGSSYAKLVLMDEDRHILAKEIRPMGISYREIAGAMLNDALHRIGKARDDITYCVSTGYGRRQVEFSDRSLTEIFCHAKALHWYFPDAQMVIDIGGQDCKVIVLGADGQVSNFLMNDKCAAGTGRFLEVMARALGIEFDQMNEYGLQEGRVARISSVCTVFAESEVISMLAGGNSVSEIVRGIYESIATRILGLVRRANSPWATRIVLSGGANQNKGLVKSLETALNTRFRCPDDPQIMGAVGACLAALEAGGESRQKAEQKTIQNDQRKEVSK